jgi:hypothetical protein
VYPQFLFVPRLVLLFAILLTPLWARDLHPEVTTVTVSVFNDAGVPPGLLSESEEVAAGVFAQAGVVLKWLLCGQPSETAEEQARCDHSDFPTQFHLRLMSRSMGPPGRALGVSYLAEDGVGSQADVFYERVMRLQAQTQMDPVILLGLIIAHELGHLLLGTNSHSPGGLMRANWSSEDLVRARKGTLLFSDDESDHMCAKLYAAFKDRNRARLALATQK